MEVPSNPPSPTCAFTAQCAMQMLQSRGRSIGTTQDRSPHLRPCRCSSHLGQSRHPVFSSNKSKGCSFDYRGVPSRSSATVTGSATSMAGSLYSARLERLSPRSWHRRSKAVEIMRKSGSLNRQSSAACFVQSWEEERGNTYRKSRSPGPVVKPSMASQISSCRALGRLWVVAKRLRYCRPGLFIWQIFAAVILIGSFWWLQGSRSLSPVDGAILSFCCFCSSCRSSCCSRFLYVGYSRRLRAISTAIISPSLFFLCNPVRLRHRNIGGTRRYRVPRVLLGSRDSFLWQRPANCILLFTSTLFLTLPHLINPAHPARQLHPNSRIFAPQQRRTARARRGASAIHARNRLIAPSQ